MSKARSKKYKLLSFSTTIRNPERMPAFLEILLPYENHLLTHTIIMSIVEKLIQKKLYTPMYAQRYFKEVLESDREFKPQEIQEIITNSPQKHKESGFAKGWDSRFDTWYKLCMEFGFCFYAMDKPLQISNTGHLLIDAYREIPSNDEKINNVFLNCLMKYYSNNPFRNTLNANMPLILLLNTMKELKNLCGDSKIHRLEIVLFLCWKNNNAKDLAHKILSLRTQYPSFNYSNENVYELCLEILESTNTTRFKISQVCAEGIDDYIRKMRITGIISLRGGGRFIDFNTFENQKIEYILKTYTKQPHFTSKEEYFTYMGNIDSHILSLQKISHQEQKDIRLQALQDFAHRYTKEQIYKELQILSSKKLSSKDAIFKFIPEPTRFEFLSAIALKQHFIDLIVLPNYSVDDEGIPKSHASGNMPDIVCKNNILESLVEVSLICGRGQVNNELLPISRHLKEHKEKSQNKEVFALFIAPKIFEDSKRYVAFLKFDENLAIYNLDIVDFIHKLKTAKSFMEIINV